MTTRHFERHGKGVFRCQICTRSTRHTTQSIDSNLCSECWELAGIENSVSDGHDTVATIAAERDRLVASAVKRGGDEAAIRKSFADLYE